MGWIVRVRRHRLSVIEAELRALARTADTAAHLLEQGSAPVEHRAADAAALLRRRLAAAEQALQSLDGS